MAKTPSQWEAIRRDAIYWELTWNSRVSYGEEHLDFLSAISQAVAKQAGIWSLREEIETQLKRTAYQIITRQEVTALRLHKSINEGRLAIYTAVQWLLGIVIFYCLLANENSGESVAGNHPLIVLLITLFFFAWTIFVTVYKNDITRADFARAVAISVCDNDVIQLYMRSKGCYDTMHELLDIKDFEYKKEVKDFLTWNANHGRAHARKVKTYSLSFTEKDYENFIRVSRLFHLRDYSEQEIVIKALLEFIERNDVSEEDSINLYYSAKKAAQKTNP